MKLLDISVLSSLMTICMSQSSVYTCQKPKNAYLFNQCNTNALQTLKLVNAGANDIYSACNGTQADLITYNTCLCETLYAVTLCFIQYCPSNSTLTEFQKQDSLFCKAAGLTVPTTNVAQTQTPDASLILTSKQQVSASYDNTRPFSGTFYFTSYGMLLGILFLLQLY